jgi:MFS family permease
VCAGVVLASLDLFIVNVALPQIGRDFHLHGSGLADLSWVLNAYAIVYASFLLAVRPAGRALPPRPRVPGRCCRVRGRIGSVRRGDQP